MGDSELFHLGTVDGKPHEVAKGQWERLIEQAKKDKLVIVRINRRNFCVISLHQAAIRAAESTLDGQLVGITTMDPVYGPDRFDRCLSFVEKQRLLALLTSN